MFIGSALRREVRPIHRFVRLLAVLGLASMSVGGWGEGAAAAAPGSELWVAPFDGRGVGSDAASGVVTSPDGSVVFVTGVSEEDYATIAYRSSTGARVWKQRYDGPGSGADHAEDLAVTPDGTTVIVTGASTGATGRLDYATVAYDAMDGTRRWIRRYDGPGTGDHGSDCATSLAVSPDGTTVFVTGSSAGPMTHADHATIAYDATTGDRIWVQRFDGARGVNDGANAIAVSPDGTAVFVTGFTDDSKFYGRNYATFAYDASTGEERWATLFDSGTGSEPGDFATSVAVSPDGGSVFVTGSTTDEYATLAYEAATGVEIWSARYGLGGYATATALAVSPDGTTVFVTGYNQRWRDRTLEPYDYATLAYDATTGERAWVRRFDGPVHGDAFASSLAVSPDGSTVYVTGSAHTSTTFDYDSDYATIAYEAATGAGRWVRLHGGPDRYSDRASSIVVSPDGATVIVTGRTRAVAGGDWDDSYLTIAYAS